MTQHVMPAATLLMPMKRSTAAAIYEMALACARPYILWMICSATSRGISATRAAA